MVNVEYKIAYNEVLEILKYISKEEYNKIPQNIIKTFKLNASSENNFRYNPNKTLQEQNVSETTRTIIAILFRDYWATNEQKEKIISVQNKEREKIEKYNTDAIFKTKNTGTNEQNSLIEETRMIVVNEEKWYKKLISLIKGLFNKTK